MSSEAKVPKPLLNAAKCDKTQLGCGDSTCLPNEYFCDGSVDWYLKKNYIIFSIINFAICNVNYL